MTDEADNSVALTNEPRQSLVRDRQGQTMLFANFNMNSLTDVARSCYPETDEALAFCNYYSLQCYSHILF